MSNMQKAADSLIIWAKNKNTITDVELQKLLRQPNYENFYNLIL